MTSVKILKYLLPSSKNLDMKKQRKLIKSFINTKGWNTHTYSQQEVIEEEGIPETHAFKPQLEKTLDLYSDQDGAHSPEEFSQVFLLVADLRIFTFDPEWSKVRTLCSGFIYRISKTSNIRIFDAGDESELTSDNLNPKIHTVIPKYVAEIIEWGMKYEQQKSLYRMKMGRQKAKWQHKSHGGRKPFGRPLQPASDSPPLSDNHEELIEQAKTIPQAALKLICELRKKEPGGRRASYCRIAQYLNSHKIPTATNSGKWYRETIRRIIKRERPYLC